VTRLDSMPLPAPRPVTLCRENVYPKDLFHRITDMLADLVLEDIKQFPKIPTDPRIDRFDGRENTVLLTQKGEA
jgi:hypothetical protein